MKKWHVVATVTGEMDIDAPTGKEAAARIREFVSYLGVGLQVGWIEVTPVPNKEPIT